MTRFKPHPTLSLITVIVSNHENFSLYLPQCCYLQKTEILMCYEIASSSHLHSKKLCGIQYRERVVWCVGGIVVCWWHCGVHSCLPRSPFKQGQIKYSAHKHRCTLSTHAYTIESRDSNGSQRNRKHDEKSSVATHRNVA